MIASESAASAGARLCVAAGCFNEHHCLMGIICVQSLAGLMGQSYVSSQPAADQILLQLLMKWAQRAFTLAVKAPGSSDKHLPCVTGGEGVPLSYTASQSELQEGACTQLDLHQVFTVTTCAPAVVRLVEPHERQARSAAHASSKRVRHAAVATKSASDPHGDGRASKRRCKSGCLDEPAADCQVCAPSPILVAACPASRRIP